MERPEPSVDNNSEIVAVGRWHRYSNVELESGKDLEYAGKNDPSSYPEGMDKDLYIGWLEALFEKRKDWMPKAHCWVLTNITTREPLQKNGAGSLILEWGLRQAAKEGVPAFLEALVTAKSLYQRHGFREVGTQTIDCARYGKSDVVVAGMRADSK